jgi:hypothetical protein
LRDNPAVDERAKRIGRNQNVFRDVNERLRAIGEGFSVVAEQAEFICECGNSSCVEQIAMPLTEYERIRSDPKRYLVVRGHEERELERVVFEGEGWVAVEKYPGGAAGLAIADDPRGGS